MRAHSYALFNSNILLLTSIMYPCPHTSTCPHTTTCPHQHMPTPAHAHTSTCPHHTNTHAHTPAHAHTHMPTSHQHTCTYIHAIPTPPHVNYRQTAETDAHTWMQGRPHLLCFGGSFLLTSMEGLLSLSLPLFMGVEVCSGDLRVGSLWSGDCLTEPLLWPGDLRKPLLASKDTSAIVPVYQDRTNTQ